MKGFLCAAALSAILGGALSSRLVAEPEIKTSSIGGGSAETSRVFRLLAGGREGKCIISTEASDTLLGRRLVIGKDCPLIHENLPAAAYWLDRDDGTVAFIDDGGAIVAEFGASDGAAFESFQPVQPMMFLVAARAAD